MESTLSTANYTLAKVFNNEAPSMLNSNVIGIDLAKNVFQVCHISIHGELLSNKAMSRQKLKEFLAMAKPSIVTVEGCASCHYWGRFAERFSHDVRIINPKKVKGYLEGHKTDANAALQISLKYSKPKTIDQQGLHSLETSRQLLTRSMVSIGQHIRATILEYGVVNAKGEIGLKKSVTSVLDGQSEMPTPLATTITMMWQQYLNLKSELKQLEKSHLI